MQPPVSENFDFYAKAPTQPPSFDFLPSCVPPRQDKSGPPCRFWPPVLVTRRSATPLDTRSRSSTVSSQPVKTAWGLLREPRRLTLPAMSKTENVILSHSISCLVFRISFFLKQVEKMIMEWDKCTWFQHKSALKSLFQASVFLCMIYIVLASLPYSFFPLSFSGISLCWSENSQEKVFTC